MGTEYTRTSAIKQIQEEQDRLRQEIQLLRDQNEVYRNFVHALHELQVARSSAKTEGDLIRFTSKALEYATASVRAADGSLLMVDSDTEELVFVQVSGSKSATLPGYRIKKGEGVAGWVAQHGAAQVVNAPYLDSRFSRRVDTYFHFVTRNLVAVPIRGKEAPLGVLEALNKTGGRDFDSYDVDMLNVIADLIAGAITRVDIATKTK